VISAQNADSGTGDRMDIGGLLDDCDRLHMYIRFPFKYVFDMFEYQL